MKNLKIVLGILSYNNPEETDALYDKLYAELESLTDFNIEFIVLDNGSDNDKIASRVTHRLFDRVELDDGIKYILKLAQEKLANIVLFCSDLKNWTKLIIE